MTYNQLNCHCLSMILLVFLYIPMAMLGFFFQLFVVMVLYNCFLDVNAESCRSYSIADVLTSLSIIKKIQKLTLFNYFQATQGTGRQVTEDQAKRE